MNLRPTPTRPARLPHEPSPGSLLLLWFVFLSLVFKNICRHLFMEAVQWSKERNGWLQSGLEIKNKRTKHYFVQHSFLPRLFIIIMPILIMTLSSSKSRGLFQLFSCREQQFHCPLVYSLDEYRCQNGGHATEERNKTFKCLIVFS